MTGSCPRIAEAGALGVGRVEVATFETERAEAEHLADLLRRAHLEDGIGWDQMAVLVRSGRNSIPGLRRALGAAGVPVEVASDDVPLVRDPAVTADARCPACRAQPRQRGPRPRGVRRPRPCRVAPHGSPRWTGRKRRTPPWPASSALARRSWPTRLRTPPRPSRELLRDAVVQEGCLFDGLSGPGIDRARSLRTLLVQARAELDPGRHRRGSALDAVVGHLLAASPAPVGGRRWGSRPCMPTGTSTRSSPSSTPRPAPRNSETTSGCATSWPRWSPSRSPPTLFPSAVFAGPRSGC